MATVLCCMRNVVFVCGNKFTVFTTSDSKKVFEHHRVKPVKPDSSESTETKDQGSSEGQANTGTGDSDPHQASGQISICDFSASGDYFAVCDDYKQLTVWRTKTEWESISTRNVPRRCVALSFDHKEENIYIADKSGDVYKYSLSNPTDDCTLIMGHVSMLLDVTVSPDNRFIVTADRDEKIRVSCLPNSYTIQSFCLGHTQFVSRLSIVPWLNSTLVSGSGDGTVRFWDYTKGQQLHKISLNALEGKTESDDTTAVGANGNNGDAISSSGGDGQVATMKDKLATVTCITCCRKHKLVAVAVSNSPTVVIYQVSESNDGLQCTQISTLNCGVSPWSICYDDSGQLWILRPIESEPLIVYAASDEADGILKFEELNSSKSDSDTSNITTQINQDTQFFQGAYNQESFYSSLHKKQIDNICSYLQRKQQRIDHQKLKQEAHSKDQKPTGKQKKQQHKQQQKQNQEAQVQLSPEKDIPVAKRLKAN